MHPALFAAIWVTAAIPLGIYLICVFYKSMGEPKNSDVVMLATLFMLAIYLVVGFFWWSFVLAVYDANHPKVTQSGGLK